MIQDTPSSERPVDFPSPAQGRSFVRIKVRHVLIEADIGCAQDMVELGSIVERTIDKTKRQRHRFPASRYVPLLPPGSKPRLLSLEAKDFLDNQREAGLAPATLEKYQAALDMLLVTVGDVLVSEISKEHIRDYWNETFRWWPHYAKSRSDLKGLSNTQILAIGKSESTKPRSFAFYRLNDAVLELFFEQLLEEKIIGVSPMRGIKKRKEVRGPKIRKDLSDEELQSIFHPENYTRWAGKYPHRWWAPMIALYTGARISEICRLKVSDIVEMHGTWCISFQGRVEDQIQDDGEGRPKTDASPRIIPIAKPLIDAGLLTFVKDVSDAKRLRLFPQLRPHRDKKTGAVCGSGYAAQHIVQFSEYLKANTSLKKGIGSHAFRHTIATRLTAKAAAVDVELIATITGHAPNLRVPTLQHRYIHADPVELCELQVEALAKFKPPVALPQYTPGQFLSRLRPGAKVFA